MNNNASIYNNLAILYAKIDKKKKAYDYFLKAIELYGNEDKVMSNYYHNIAKLYEEDKNYDKAIFYYLKRINILEELDDKDILINAYDNIANLYYSNNNYNGSLKYYFKEIGLLKKEINYENVLMIINVNQNIINIYNELNNCDKILDCYLDIILFLKKTDNLEEEEKDFLLSHLYMLIGNYYKDNNNYELAKEYYLKNIDIREKLKKKDYLFNDNLLMISYLHLLSVYNSDDKDNIYLIKNKLNEIVNG